MISTTYQRQVKMKCNNTQRPDGIKAAIGRISYINVAPVYHGLDNGQQPDWLKMVDGAPNVLNRMMMEEKIDISPVSSVAYARNHDRWMVLPDLSISCFGEVMSVILAAKSPIEELDGKKILLTRDSATSVDLLKLVFAKKGVTPLFETGVIKSPEDVPEGFEGALIIGDAALTGNWSGQYEHVWDLGKLWLELTGLPFVFALWTVRRSFAEENPDTVSRIVELFRVSKETGNGMMDEIAGAAAGKLSLSSALCRRYYELLDCDLSPLHKKGAEMFFQGLWEQGILPDEVKLDLFQP